jgi:hypothetical protein
MAHHGSVTDPTNLHQFWNWRQATDPATTDPTLVANGQSWLDTTTSPYALKVRVAGAWVTVGSASSYTAEDAMDDIAAAFAAGTHTGLTITYTDGSDKFDFAVTGGGLTQEQIEDFIGTTLLVAGTGITVTYNDAGGTITIASTVSAYTDEQAQDAVAAMIAAGTHTGLTATYNDAGNSMSFAVTGGGLTQEQIEDFIGTTLLVAGSGVTVTYNDAAGTITIAVNGSGKASFQWVLDEGGVPATNYKGWLYVPFNCTIDAVYVVADQTGDIVIDVWKDSYANFPPTVADTITAAAKPTLVGAQKYTDATLTGWNKTLTAGDFITIKVDSAATVTLVTVVLVVTKS